MRYHLIPVRMAIIKKTTNNSYWRRCVEKGTLVHCWWVCKLVQPLWKTVWRFLKKLKIEVPYDPEIPLLGIFLKKTKTLIQKDACTLMFTAILLTIAKIWKQLKCSSIDEWIKKMFYMYTHIYEYIYIYIYTHTHTHIYVYIYRHKHIYKGILLSHKNE